MRNSAMEASKLGCRRTRACLALGAVMLMGLHASVRAESKQEPPAPPTAAEPAPAPSASSPDAETNSTPAQAVPPSASAPAPAPPPPACVPPAPYDPPPGYGSPYDRPPPGYPYPPPGYGPGPYAPPPSYPYGHPASPFPRYEAPLPDEERQHATPSRIFMFSLGSGLGALSGGFSTVGSSFRLTEPGLSYTLRFAAAVNDSWLVQLALDGTWVQFSDRRLVGSTDWSSTTYTIGAQYFVLPSLYSRLGVGLGCLGWSDEYSDHSSCRMAASGGVGLEFLQQHTMSVAAELVGTILRSETFIEDDNDGYLNHVWFSLGANVVVSFF